MTIPSVGRIVHYVAESDDFDLGGEHRAAIITDTLSKLLVSLAVLAPEGIYFVRGVPYDLPDENEDFIAGTWHYPERVDE